MTYFIPDVSHYQKGLSVRSLKKQGFDALIAKCTQGVHYFDPEYNNFRLQAKKNFMPFAAYHFLEHGNVKDQVKNLAFHIHDKSIPVMVDFEPTKTSRPTWRDYTDFLRYAHEEGLVVSLTYLPHWYWEQVGAHSLENKPALVQSMYPWNNRHYASVIYHNAGSRGWEKMGGVKPTLWQFTSVAKISGFSGNVDISAFEGTQRELLKLFKDYNKKPAAKNILAAIRYFRLARSHAKAHNNMNRVETITKLIRQSRKLL